MSDRRVDQLTPAERQALAECETAIERTERGYIEKGTGLLRIRDERLYRETHDNFEDYCEKRWALSKPYASQLIVAVAVVAIATADPSLPTPPNEAVARALAPLRSQPEQLRAAWSEAVKEHGRPTATQVGEIVLERLPEPTRRPADHWRALVRWAEAIRRMPPPAELEVPDGAVELMDEALPDLVGYVDEFAALWGESVSDRRAAAERREQERELGTAKRELRESERGLSSPPYPCENSRCGRFKQRPSQICSYCGNDPVTYNGDRLMYDREHGCENL